MDLYKMHRKASIRLRKRRDQAKKDFLQESQSDQFPSDIRHDGWSYMSFKSPSAQSRTSGPVSLFENTIRRELLDSNAMMNSPRSLGYIPTMSSKYYQHGPSLHSSLLAVSNQAMTETEDHVRNRGRGGRGSEESRDRKLWRRSAIGLGEEERARRVVYKDFGFIDNPHQFESHSEINVPFCKQER